MIAIMRLILASLMLLSCFYKPLEAKTSICFIVNPISGMGKQKKIDRLIKKHLDHSQFDYKILYTKGPKHATSLSQDAAQKGIDIIVAVGGDGSVNEVAQGMIGSRSMLGIIPTGSGNGLARHFAIPIQPSEAIQVINQLHSQWIDTVRINNKTYLGVAGVGFDANVSQAFANLEKRGLTAYLRIIFNELPYYKPQNYQLIIDGKPINEQAFLICFANTKQYGNNAFIAPNAKIDDGFLDVIIWKAFPPHAAPKLVHDLFTKHLDDSKYTKTIRCQEVILKKPLNLLHIDGEPLECQEDVYMRILPSSLKILTPQPTETDHF